MKTLNRIAFAAVLAATVTLGARANAQYRATEEDGIAASPKVRQMLNERKGLSPAKEPSVLGNSFSLQPGGPASIAASPKVSQKLAERKAGQSVPSAAVAFAGYRATGEDGVTASPKLRQQLNERSPQFMIAPLK